jgi:hypothetical protein
VVSARQNLQLPQQRRIAATPARWCDVEHDAAPDGSSGSLVAREAASDEAVPGKQGDGHAVDVKSSEASGSGLEGIRRDRCQVGSPLRSARQELDGDAAVRLR